MTPPFLGTWELPHFSHSTEPQQWGSSYPLRSETDLMGLRGTPTPQELALEWEVLVSHCWPPDQEDVWAQEFRAGKSRQRHDEKQRRCERGKRKAGGGRLSGESLVPGPQETQLRPCSWTPGGASCPYVTSLLNGLDPGRCKKKPTLFFPRCPFQPALWTSFIPSRC